MLEYSQASHTGSRDCDVTHRILAVGASFFVFAPVGREDETDMADGKVKWFSSDKGYGFIERESGDDLFVHISELQGGATTLAEGQAVSFTEATGQNGKKQATQVSAV